MNNMSKDCSTRCSSFFLGPFFSMYATYFWATWGNRMWNFAFGLYLVDLAERNLRLTAIYGFLMSICILLFGSYIGTWVDKTNRRTAIRTSIILQKVFVILCSITVCATMQYTHNVHYVDQTVVHHSLNGAVILLAILAELATMSYQRMELEKDWFVVITEGNESKLANLNTATRLIDQITNIATPLVTGVIMASVSKFVSGLVIIGWHLMALIVELLLTSRIYSITPGMAKKKYDSSPQSNPLATEPSNKATKEEFESFMNETSEEVKDGYVKEGKNLDSSPQSNPLATEPSNKATKEEFESFMNETSEEVKDGYVKEGKRGFCEAVLFGWKIYARQTVVFAGISLAMLYMTVLGFDGITTGYIYANGLSETLIGFATAASSIAGMIGALLYKPLHRCLGLERTGIFSFTFQATCLTLCLMSIWLPGSPFEPEALTHYFAPKQADAHASELAGNFSFINMTVTTESASDTDSGKMLENVTVSILCFVIAIVTSRIGLWISDLVVCQLQQENVPESARGTVNGVQNSLNSLMDMLKSILVIFFPTKETFGYLIILSFCFVSGGVLTFYFHAFKSSGYSLNSCMRGKTVGKPVEKKIETDIESIDFKN